MMTPERRREIEQMLEPREVEVWQDDDPGHPASRPYKVKQMHTPQVVRAAIVRELLDEINRLELIECPNCEGGYTVSWEDDTGHWHGDEPCGACNTTGYLLRYRDTWHDHDLRDRLNRIYTASHTRHRQHRAHTPN